MKKKEELWKCPFCSYEDNREQETSCSNCWTTKDASERWVGNFFDLETGEQWEKVPIDHRTWAKPDDWSGAY